MGLIYCTVCGARNHTPIYLFVLLNALGICSQSLLEAHRLGIAICCGLISCSGAKPGAPDFPAGEERSAKRNSVARRK